MTIFCAVFQCYQHCQKEEIIRIKNMYALSGSEVKYPEIFIKNMSVFRDFRNCRKFVNKPQNDHFLQYFNATGTVITRTSQGLQIRLNCQDRKSNTRDIHKKYVRFRRFRGCRKFVNKLQNCYCLHYYNVIGTIRTGKW